MSFQKIQREDEDVYQNMVIWKHDYQNMVISKYGYQNIVMKKWLLKNNNNK